MFWLLPLNSPLNDWGGRVTGWRLLCCPGNNTLLMNTNFTNTFHQTGDKIRNTHFSQTSPTALYPFGHAAKIKVIIIKTGVCVCVLSFLWHPCSQERQRTSGDCYLCSWCWKTGLWHILAYSHKQDDLLYWCRLWWLHYMETAPAHTALYLYMEQTQNSCMRLRLFILRLIHRGSSRTLIEVEPCLLSKVAFAKIVSVPVTPLSMISFTSSSTKSTFWKMLFTVALMPGGLQK